jgi:hypothetical protein
MINKPTTTFKGLLIVILFAFLSNITPSHAGARGTYKGLYFPGADAQKCGGWYVAAPQEDASQWVRFERPGVVSFKVIDGTKKVVMEGSQNIFDNFAPNVTSLSLPAFGLPNAD